MTRQYTREAGMTVAARRKRSVIPIHAAERLCEMRAFERVWRAILGEFNHGRKLPHWAKIHRFASDHCDPLPPKEFKTVDLMFLVASRIPGKWMSEPLVGLLHRIEKDPTVLPVIADCIEDAGCDDVELLNALRMTT